MIDRVIRTSGGISGRDEQERALEELTAVGEPAIQPILRAMEKPTPEGVHCREASEGLLAALGRMARIDPGPLAEFVSNDQAMHEPRLDAVVWALGKSRADRAVEALVVASRHRSAPVRLAAIEGLIATRDPRSIDPVLRALNDRSPRVRFTAVQEVNTTATDFYRVSEAAENLRKLLCHKGLKTREPGCFREATLALEKMEREQSQTSAKDLQSSADERKGPAKNQS